MAWGTMAVDWETRVDFDRLRKYRLQRAKVQLEKHNLGAVLCFDFNNIRYITSTTLGEWARDKLMRFVLLPRGQEPFSFEGGSSAASKRLYSPWVKDRIRMARMWARGGVPDAAEVCEAVGRDIAEILHHARLQRLPHLLLPQLHLRPADPGAERHLLAVLRLAVRCDKHRPARDHHGGHRQGVADLRGVGLQDRSRGPGVGGRPRSGALAS